MLAHLEEYNTIFPVLPLVTSEAALAIGGGRFRQNHGLDTSGIHGNLQEKGQQYIKSFIYLEVAPHCQVKLLLLGKVVLKNQTLKKRRSE